MPSATEESHIIVDEVVKQVSVIAEPEKPTAYTVVVPTGGVTGANSVLDYLQRSLGVGWSYVGNVVVGGSSVMIFARWDGKTASF